MKNKTLGLGFAILSSLPLLAVVMAQTADAPVTRQEMLRGTITPEREWWDVLHYDLSVQFVPGTRTIQGSNVITFKTLKPGSKMQIDLQTPLAISKVLHGSTELKFEREGSAWTAAAMRRGAGP